MFVDTNICRSGIHSHCFTCRKPPKGYTGCRMCKPSGLTVSTSPVQLIAAESVPESEYKRKMDDENTVHIFEDTFLSTKTIDSKPDETERDNRLIVWEIKRPELDSLPQCAVSSDDDEDVKQWHLDKLETAMKTDDTGMEPEETIHRSDENDRTIKDILKDLKKLSQDDLVALYQSVSDKLSSRNGMVTDYNPVLTSVMGCNTNSLFWGHENKARERCFTSDRTYARIWCRS